MNDVFVYGLYDGLSNQAFYVGITSSPKKRLWCHKAALDGKRKDSLTGCAVKSAGVTMRLFAACDDRANAEMIEKALQRFLDIKVIK